MPLQTKLSLADMESTDTVARPSCKPLCLHVYRIGGFWGDDKIVRADDRKTPRYFSKGTRHATSWEFALHVGDPNGVVVCHVKSPYLGPPLMATGPSPVNVTIIGSERHVVQVHRGSKSSDGMYAFRGLDDNEYRWQPLSWVWGKKMECLNSQNQVVATYRITLFAVSKDGELRVHQPAQPMTDLLLATCLAMRTPDY